MKTTTELYDLYLKERQTEKYTQFNYGQIPLREFSAMPLKEQYYYAGIDMKTETEYKHVVKDEDGDVLFEYENIKPIEVPEQLSILLNQLRPFIKPVKGFGMDEIVTLIAKCSLQYSSSLLQERDTLKQRVEELVSIVDKANEVIAAVWKYDREPNRQNAKDLSDVSEQYNSMINPAP